MDIGVWGLWDKCRPHSFAAIIRSVHHKHVLLLVKPDQTPDEHPCCVSTAWMHPTSRNLRYDARNRPLYSLLLCILLTFTCVIWTQVDVSFHHSDGRFPHKAILGVFTVQLLQARLCSSLPSMRHNNNSVSWRLKFTHRKNQCEHYQNILQRRRYIFVCTSARESRK